LLMVAREVGDLNLVSLTHNWFNEFSIPHLDAWSQDWLTTNVILFFSRQVLQQYHTQQETPLSFKPAPNLSRERKNKLQRPLKERRQGLQWLLDETRGQ
jgi:hypothetical protein